LKLNLPKGGEPEEGGEAELKEKTDGERGDESERKAES